MHRYHVREVLRDVEVARAISPVVRKHVLTVDQTTEYLRELAIPRAKHVAELAGRSD